MIRTALRSLRTHTIRFLLPAFAVVLGVAFTSGSLIHAESVRADQGPREDPESRAEQRYQHRLTADDRGDAPAVEADDPQQTD
ncbi:hypothetical protein, partial [Streptomyces clavuligerus]|uniref:hypothetical protein n=1 Tax=Streptomyces clavuligerus TaxID=1901 RepID=UPI0018D126C2